MPVSDVARAVAFFEVVFGMEKTFENGDPVGFVILKRDGAELHLTLVERSRRQDAQRGAMLVDEGVDELYRRCEAAEGARIIERIRDAPWGLRTFVVADPDGNRLDIGQRH